MLLSHNEAVKMLHYFGIFFVQAHSSVTCYTSSVAWKNIPGGANVGLAGEDIENTIQYNTMRVFSAPYTRNWTGRHYIIVIECV